MNTSNYQNGISPFVGFERSLITSLYAEECELAIKKWEEMLSSFSEIKKASLFSHYSILKVINLNGFRSTIEIQKNFV